MKFKTKSQSDFFRDIEKLAIKNNIRPAGGGTFIDINTETGVTTIEISSQFLIRLKEANIDDYNSLVSLYS